VSENEARIAVMPLRVRYFEADQQGVVFNMWYLAYFEDARNHYLETIGYPLTRLLSSGYDIQVVATELAWKGPVRWGEEDITIRTHVAKVGGSSLTFRFEVVRGDRVLVTGKTVYVIIALDGSGKRPVPDELRLAVEPQPATPSTEETS
jgi:acyl-CoA thioester hydrolase